MIKQRYMGLFLALYFVLGSWKGYVALFRGGEEEPWQIFPTKVASLPPVDRQALEDGITVRSQKRLEQLMEDFLS